MSNNTMHVTRSREDADNIDYLVECEDGTYSHAGGISGACSDHGGES